MEWLEYSGRCLKIEGVMLQSPQVVNSWHLQPSPAKYKCCVIIIIIIIIIIIMLNIYNNIVVLVPSSGLDKISTAFKLCKPLKSETQVQHCIPSSSNTSMQFLGLIDINFIKETLYDTL